jgi:hypothetical protein
MRSTRVFNKVFNKESRRDLATASLIGDALRGRGVAA